MIASAASELSVSELQVSNYVHSHDVDESTVGLYTPFNHEVTFLPKPHWRALNAGDFSALPAPVLQDLATRGFLVPENFDGQALSRVAAPAIPGFISLWLLAVKTCNMGCRYCVVDAEEQTRQLSEAKEQNTPKGRMPPEVATAGIAMFRRSLERHRAPIAKATIYGGEPLLNRPLLHQAIPALRAMTWTGQQAPLEILCFTNGVTYDPAVTELFKAHNVTVGLSLDGMKEQHDAARPLLNGAGTFDKVVESYHKYREAGLNVGVSCTIGKHNVKELPEIARYFVEELKVPALQLQTPIQAPGNNNPLYLTMREAAESAWEAFRLLRERGVEEGLTMRRLSRFMTGQFHHRDCFAVGGELVVSPDGTLGPCHNATIGGEQYFKGNVLDQKFDPERASNFVEWHARMPINMPGCHGCSFIGLCGGGCPYNALLTRGSIWEKDPHQCGYMEQFVNLLLEDVWQRYNGQVEQAA